MTDFIDDKAFEEEEPESEYNPVELKKLKKLKQIASDSSEEEEDDEDDVIREESKGFIDDDEEEVEDEEDSGSDSEHEGKRKRDEEDDDDLDADNLDEDDLALIEENIGVKLDRKKKFKRLKRIEDEDSEDEGQTQEGDEMQGARGSEDEDDEENSHVGGVRRSGADEYDSEGIGSASDEENFIVDDNDQPIQKTKRKAVFDDEGLEAARDIFGCDFDYNEFRDYEELGESEEEEEEEEEEDYVDDEEVDSVVKEPRPKKTKDKKKPQRKTVFEVFEPSELERGHLTDFDQEIRKTDVPERFQLRSVPVQPTRQEGDDRAADKELENEARWIYHHAFFKPYISNQDGRKDARSRSKKDQYMIQKICNALDLIRNSTCEVPFIAFYRKEEVIPELTIHDLWKVYNWDEKWCQLKLRKENLKLLLQKMAEYQADLIMKDLEAPLPEGKRLLKEEDIQRIDEIETPEQFNDVYKHFLLHYGNEQLEMRAHLKKKARQNRPKRTITKIVKIRRVIRRKKHRKAVIDEDDDDNDDEKQEESEEEVETDVETEVEEEIDDTDDLTDENPDELKKAVRRHEFDLLKKAGIEPLARKFGLTPEQFGENMRDNYQRCDVEQVSEDPVSEAEQCISKVLTTPEQILEAAVRMVGWQLACEPLVRKAVRDLYFERVKLSVKATPKGLKLIDELHPLYDSKYLKDKPVSDLKGDQFLRIKMGVEENLIALSFSDTMMGYTSKDFLDEMKQLYYRDEFSQLVQDWNALRGRAIEFAYKHIIEDLKRELTQKLLQEAKEHVIDSCCTKLYNWLKVAPYNPGDFNEDDDDDRDWNTDNGFRVFAIAYVPDLSEAGFGACIDGDGDCCEYIRLPHLLKRRDAYIEHDALAKENDIRRIREFVVKRKPHVVVIGAESREALIIVNEIKAILSELEESEDEYFPKINVELLENDLSKVYSYSKKGEQDFLDYPPLLRQAVSLGRRLQDPHIEFSQLCNLDDEILNIRFHPLQAQVSRSELLNALYTEFVNRTNEVGVDLNKAVAYPHTQNLVQFVCGLGPRKANQILKQMKASHQRLENRNQLVVNFHMGPKVFINSAGFIKIDTSCLGDSDNYIEVLDSTRIHPEAYDWARKMAVDALEYEDEEGKPAEALEEILDTPDKLSELDLAAFATELFNQGFGRKNQTLYDIRHELNHRYKDFRQPYRPPTSEEIFNMLTKETPETFYIGKLVQATVIHFIHRKPKGEQLDNANPVRNEETGLWQCPFCLKNDFPELSEVWNHFDADECPGEAVGIRVKLDNGISGFISIKNLSDKNVVNPADRVRKGAVVHCRIMKINPDHFSVELTSRTSDLQDKDNKWKAPKDSHYDFDSESIDAINDAKKREKKNTQYQKRVIVHPSFHNIDFNEAEKLMQTLEQGDVIIRPSSKGIDHLTVTWKVTDGVCQHIDIREQDKQNDFSLGHKLWIGNEEFEDLDEIIARYIHPMAFNARQILEYKYFKDYWGNKEKAAEYLKEEKKKNSKNIPYVFHVVKNLPGKFMLSYLPRVKVIHEYVTVIPEGFRFRRKIQFSTLANLLKWFKINFRQLAPGVSVTPALSTRTPYMGGTTPMMMSEGGQKGVGLASQLTLGGGASATPYTATPGGYSTYSNYGNANTPYTPSGQTPFMTPYNTPGPSTTPRYGGHSSSQNIFRGLPGEGRTPHRASLSGRREHASWSTPKTINSPANMSIGGDQTPLYDE